MKYLLPLLIFLSFSFSTFAQCNYESKDPYKAADYIVKSIKENNVADFICSLNAINKNNIGTEKKAKEALTEIREKSKNTFNKVTEIRFRKFNDRTLYYCKYGELNDKIFAVVLTKENENYFFEDAHTPSKKSFWELEPFKK